jgi:hypothetical protein
MAVQINFHGGPFDGEGQVVDNVITGMGNTITVYTNGDGATGTYTYVSVGAPPGTDDVWTASYNFAFVPPL